MSGDLPRWNLGILEASGLGLRREPRSGAPEVLALGDRSRIVVGLRPDDTGRLPAVAPTYRYPVRDLPAALDHGQSQWEGVAGDPSGRVFILRERSSELLVVSPDFRFERRIMLHHDWPGDTQFGLEGLLWLRDGHLLAAKQKNPVRLIEFGPAGTRPLGLNATAWLPPGTPATLSPLEKLHQLAAWTFADPKPASVNDLAVHADQLYVISSDDRRISRVRLPAGEPTPGTEPIEIDDWWRLPKGVGSGPEAKAEGLLVDDRLGVLVCADGHHDGYNVYRVGGAVGDLHR